MHTNSYFNLGVLNKCCQYLPGTLVQTALPGHRNDRAAQDSIPAFSGIHHAGPAHEPLGVGKGNEAGLPVKPVRILRGQQETP